MNKKLIKFIKGICIPQTKEFFSELMPTVNNELIDVAFKAYFKFPFDSLTHQEVTKEHLIEYILCFFQYADRFGFELDYPKDEIDKQIFLDFNRTEK